MGHYKVEENIAIVKRWLDISISGDLSEMNQLIAEGYTIHQRGETLVLSPEQQVQHFLTLRQKNDKAALYQVELFGQRDKVAVIYSMQTANEPISAVQIHRVTNSRIEETWAQPVAKGILWTWEAEISGDNDPETNISIFRRWYEEVYPEANWQLVPEITGPIFIRHERKEFQMTGEEYSHRLRKMFEQLGPVKIKYEAIAAADKVAVIGEVTGFKFVQAWRVRNGQLVESWWAGPGGL